MDVWVGLHVAVWVAGLRQVYLSSHYTLDVSHLLICITTRYLSHLHLHLSASFPRNATANANVLYDSLCAVSAVQVK